jgi:hypothetical protein
MWAVVPQQRSQLSQLLSEERPLVLADHDRVEAPIRVDDRRLQLPNDSTTSDPESPPWTSGRRTRAALYSHHR